MDPVLGVDTAGEPFHTPSQATDPKCQESVLLPVMSMVQQSSLTPSLVGQTLTDRADGGAVAAPNAVGTADGSGARQPGADTRAPAVVDDAARPMFGPAPTPTATPGEADQ